MSSSGAAPDPSSVVSCSDALNALFACGGPAHQLDRYYTRGALDDCARELAEMRLCLHLKVADARQRRELVRELLREPPSTTVGVVWERAPAAGERGTLSLPVGPKDVKAAQK